MKIYFAAAYALDCYLVPLGEQVNVYLAGTNFKNNSSRNYTKEIME